MGILLKCLSIAAFITTIVRSELKWMIFTLLIIFFTAIVSIGEQKNMFPKNPPEKNQNDDLKGSSNGNNSIYS